MSNTYFKFKQFTILQDKCAMKVGMDGVTLGAWVDIESTKQILDIGTGTGLIALMLAQRSSSFIDAIDIDGDACEQAKENSINSTFAEQIRVYHHSLASFSEITTNRYDLIVSNPPYFTKSFKSPEEKRSLARHNDNLSLKDLIEISKTLLKPHGRIALILPFDQESELKQAIAESSLYIIRRTDVIPVIGGNAKRILAEIAIECNPDYQPETLTIEIERHIYTPVYQELTKDFYLKI